MTHESTLILEERPPQRPVMETVIAGLEVATTPGSCSVTAYRECGEDFYWGRDRKSDPNEYRRMSSGDNYDYCHRYRGELYCEKF